MIDTNNANGPEYNAPENMATAAFLPKPNKVGVIQVSRNIMISNKIYSLHIRYAPSNNAQACRAALKNVDFIYLAVGRFVLCCDKECIGIVG
jgi:hypothetical protein